MSLLTDHLASDHCDTPTCHVQQGLVRDVAPSGAGSPGDAAAMYGVGVIDAGCACHVCNEAQSLLAATCQCTHDSRVGLLVVDSSHKAGHGGGDRLDAVERVLVEVSPDVALQAAA